MNDAIDLASIQAAWENEAAQIDELAKHQLRDVAGLTLHQLFKCRDNFGRLGLDVPPRLDAYIQYWMDLRNEDAVTWRRAEAYAIWFAQVWVALSGRPSKQRAETLRKLKDSEERLKNPDAVPPWSSKKEENHV